MTTVPATIVMYHSISPRTGLRPDTITPASLARQLALIKARYRVVRLADLPAAMLDRARPRPVAVTFDDALADFWEHGYDVLRTAQVPATMFVPTAWIGTRNTMTAAQLEAVQDEGLVEIGSHTVTHRSMRQLPWADMQREAVESKMVLEDLFGRPVMTFAFPFGQRQHVSAECVRAVRDAGYNLAVTTCWGTRQSPERLFELRRIYFEDRDDERTIAAKVEGHYDWRRFIETAGHVARQCRAWFCASGLGSLASPPVPNPGWSLPHRSWRAEAAKPRIRQFPWL